MRGDFLFSTRGITQTCETTAGVANWGLNLLRSQKIKQAASVGVLNLFATPSPGLNYRGVEQKKPG